jgi:ABC-type sugar transport system substrate-binding protein
MKANPKIGMVLSSEHNGLTASFQAMNDLGESRPYVVAGYSSDESSGTMTRNGEFAAAAIYSADRLLRKSIMTAAALMRGENVPDRVELVVPVNQSPPAAGAPRMYRMMGSTSAEGKKTEEPTKAGAPQDPTKSR